MSRSISRGRRRRTTWRGSGDYVLGVGMVHIVRASRGQEDGQPVRRVSTRLAMVTAAGGRCRR
jgi:hypothetical protein